MKMKRLFLLVALAAATLSLSAQHKMQVWEGALYSEFATTKVDSVTFLASPTGTPKPTGIVHDTITKEVHDTITIIQVVHDTVYNYAVVLTPSAYGTITADKTGAVAGEKITLAVTPATGYELEAITVKDANDTDIAVTDNSTFIMPASNATVSATFRKIDYTITIASCENGYVTASSTAQMGDEVTLTLSSNAYYIPKTISVLQGKTVIPTTPVAGTTNQYTFTMPAGEVTITAEFEKVASAFTPAAFSVDNGKQILFSQGNLQCSGLTTNDTTWSFAEYQTEMLGTDNVSGSALADKIDLFGWSADNTTAKWGISTSLNNTDYSGDFVDWGENTIGTNASNTYRTLTYEEWEYLFKYRTDADKKQGVARIYLNNDGTEYANGLILLPDSWNCPEDITFKSGFSGTSSVQAYADYQTFTLSDWQRLEAAGAVFLPALGYLYGSGVYNVQLYGSYWSATPGVTDVAYGFYFYSDCTGYGVSGRYYGRAVRLVQDL